VRLIRLFAAAGVGALAALALAAPAAAHRADAPDGTNYRTSVTAVEPSPAGLTVRAIEAGGRLELTNRTGRPIEILGYSGEPYLEVRPDGVYENVRSPATYLNTSLDGGTEPPVTADPTAAPQWRRVSSAPVARWHDHRTHWMLAEPPPAVAADPGREHRIRDWVVPLRDQTSTMEIRGTLDWLPPPAPALWWVGVALGAAGLAALGALVTPSRPATVATVALAVAATVVGITAVAVAVARELDAGADGLGAVLRGLLLGQVWPVLTGLAAVSAGVLALARGPAADFALALAGACVGLFAGVTNAAVFARSVLPLPWPPTVARLAVTVVIAGGAGLALAAVLRMRATARATTAATDQGRP
jgi:hypothetical protein